MLANPRNCEMVLLRHDGNGRLRFSGHVELQMKEKAKEADESSGYGNKQEQFKESIQSSGYDSQNEVHVVGHKFMKRLSVLPEEYIRKVHVRISFDDES
jgi:hypothetical protein